MALHVTGSADKLEVPSLLTAWTLDTMGGPRDLRKNKEKQEIH